MAAVAGGGERLSVCREQVTRTLKAALAQGRLTEDEYDERMGHASASRSRAELAALTADLPVGRMDAPARPPTAKDVRIGVIVSIAAAGMAAAILLWRPDNGLAFVAFAIAAVTVLVAPIVTVGMMADVWRQKRSSGQLPPGPTPFNRARYDAEMIVADFAARLRETVDMDAVRADLADAVNRAFEPASISVWLATPDQR